MVVLEVILVLKGILVLMVMVHELWLLMRVM